MEQTITSTNNNNSSNTRRGYIKKTDRKNNTNLDVHWIQDRYFTIQELLEENKKFTPQYREITLRVKLQNARDAGKVAEIGLIPSGNGTKGRPKLVFAMAPVADSIISTARENGVNLHSEFENVAVINITPADASSEKSSEQTSASPKKAYASA
jgi:hypothetical protein